MAERVRFEVIGGHFLSLPVRVAGATQARFLFDTGIGLTVLTPELARAVKCVAGHDVHTGRRMSGQEVTLPLARLSELAVGSRSWRNVPVGIFDFLPARPALPAEFSSVGGILSPGAFDGAPFTLDGPGRCLVLEDPGSLVERRARGRALPLRAVREGPSLGLFVDLDLPGPRRAAVEVDTGSGGVILDTRFMVGLGLSPGAPGVRTVEGSDETGHPYVRHFVEDAGPFRLSGAPAATFRRSPAMFQRIIHDGLVGTTFLLPFTLTFDVEGRRLIVAREGARREPSEARSRPLDRARRSPRPPPLTSRGRGNRRARAPRRASE